ncbi:phosphatidate cytidylyltransferase-like, putative [Bodo saltans]|uniref:Phosphatidate cytidylyltransferase n=1 Tax=Bodo saltans TaxID=75058 RepID=A0A0S4IRI0_BODSA|nr:phosphatidate cytidylyltransferase-like, putative [Bodo saltans]|eukprot:CUF47068.1 phosphatidate cytidylyltransferase-like, putative [Bodo saltans]
MPPTKRQQSSSSSADSNRNFTAPFPGNATPSPSTPKKKESQADISPAKRLSSPPAPLIDPSIIRRGVTIFVVAPTVLTLVTKSSLLLGFLTWVLTLIAMIEWTSLKRHLKVNLLWAASSVNRISADGSPGTTPKRDETKKQQQHQQQSVHSNQGDEDDVVCTSLMALEQEYPLPVAQLNTFIIGKCIGSSLIVLGAMISAPMFHFSVSVYFLFWVLFTLMGRNRSETTAVRARRRIAATTTATPPLISDAQQQEAAHQQQIVDVFHILELHVIAEFFTTELFFNFCLEYFGLVWISGLSYSILLAQVPKIGVMLMVVVLVSNWSNDIAALIVGKSLKGHTRPLYPKISPNKSLEGAVFGVLANGVTAAVLVLIFGPGSDEVKAVWGTENPGMWFFLIGLLMGVVGVMGDLLQSLFKRTARLKDTGAVFPGHGGVLDRIDGLLIVYPAAYWVLWVAMHLGVVNVA